MAPITVRENVAQHFRYDRSRASRSYGAHGPCRQPRKTTNCTRITGTASSTWLDWANEHMNQAKFTGGRSNLWSEPANVQLIKLNAGDARTIAVIITGPVNQWNSRITIAAMPAVEPPSPGQAV